MSVDESVVAIAFGQSDVGLVRENNEDNFLIADLTEGSTTPNALPLRHLVGDKGSLFLVADGMGGAEAGEVASKMAVELIAQQIFEQLADAKTLNRHTFVESLKESIEKTNLAILHESQNNHKRRGMGTTLTAAAVYDRCIFFAQLGDSRGYLVRNGFIAQMTQDQSLVAQLVASGSISAGEAKEHPQRNVILQALGVQKQVDVIISFAELRRGDTVVLCTDGLSGKVDAEEVRELIERWSEPKDACERLVGLARERGGEDNITVIVVRFDGDGLPLPMPKEIPRYDRYDKEKRWRFWP